MPIKGDFISFTYNGVHSTDLGIVRVSASNRYNDDLLPTIQDKTVQVPGSNGVYFFGSYYTQKLITVNIAYDGLTESQIRLMRKILSDGHPHALIFDDEPYKVYYAKVTGTPQLQYIPFNSYEDLNEIKRIYKGEGTLTFTCYEPFAHCPDAYKNYDDWVVGNPIWYKYDNKAEWNLSAQLREASTHDKWRSNSKSFLLYNPGDLEADFFVTLPINTGLSELIVSNSSTLESTTLALRTGMEAKGTDTHIRFNSKMNLIEGLIYDEATGYTKSVNIYNEYINNGTWPKIPKSLSTNWELTLANYNGSSASQDLDYELRTDTFILSAGETNKTFVASGDMIVEVTTQDAITNEVILTGIEVIDRRVTVSLNEASSHNIQIIVTSKRNNPNVPFIQYDYLYL